jgi:phospholipid/cholesterol/gamma-HCH transport system substrate-binding protein
VARLSLDPTVKLPSDSTAKITSDGLLGGVHVAIAPGGAADNLKPGGEIENTQGAVDLFGLIGQVMRPQPPNAAPAAPAPAAAEAP